MNENTLEKNSEVAKKALFGIGWNYLSFVLGRLFNFISTLILARILVPQQFGLVAYCTLAIQYLDIINQSGLDDALIARKDKVEQAANSAFVANVIMGIVSFGIAWITAPEIALFFKNDGITPLFRLLALVLPLSTLGLVPYTLLSRNLRFRTKFIPDIFNSFSKGIVSIPLALLGFGPWSLIWGQIAGTLVSTILSWILADWRPSWTFDRSATRGVLIYGGHITFGDFLGNLRANVDYIIVGRILGAAPLGIYTLSYRIPQLLINSINTVVDTVTFPLISKLGSDKENLRSIYFIYVRYIALFTFPIGFGLALISDFFVESFLSQSWLPVILPMALVSIALAISSVGYVPGVIYKAINRPEILNWLSMIQIPTVILILWFASRWGINGVAAGQIVFACFSFALDSYMVSRIISIHAKDLWGALMPAVVCTTGMVAVVSIFKFALPLSGIIGLISVVLIGAITFLLLLSFVDRSLVNQVMGMLKQIRTRS